MLNIKSKNQIKNSYIKAIVLNITNKCNLKCLHCFNSSSMPENGKNELNDDEIIDLVNQFIELNVGNVCFSGGEPLTRRDLLLKCLKKLQDNKIRTSIVSNGTLIDENTSYLLKILGVAEIEISLDGILDKTHEKLRGVTGSFNKAMSSIQYLVNAGIATSVSFTLTSWNGNEFYKMVEELVKIGVYGVYVRPLMIMGAAFENVNYLCPDKKQYRDIARDVCKLNSVFSDTEIYVSDPLNHIIDSRRTPTNPYVEIQHDGRLLCSYCINLSYGNIRKHSLKEYYDAGLARVWQLPDIEKITSNIYCYDELSDAIKHIPLIKDGKMSHFDIVDNVDTIWERCIL